MADLSSLGGHIPADTLRRPTISMSVPLERSTPSQDRDFALVRRIAAGNDDALRELYAAYGQRLYAYAARITGDPALAEDVVQESLVAVWKSAGRFRGEGRVLAWLLSIVHHKALNVVRIQSPVALDEQVDRLADTAPSPDERVTQSEQRYQLRAGLERLSIEHRTVLELVFYQGLSLREAAQVCNCPVGTIYGCGSNWAFCLTPRKPLPRQEKQCCHTVERQGSHSKTNTPAPTRG